MNNTKHLMFYRLKTFEIIRNPKALFDDILQTTFNPS